MLFFHGSPVRGIKVLLPHLSNHGRSLVYLSQRRENTLVYLSNAVEKYHRDNNIPHDGPFTTWASYGFDRDGILRLEEYYPNATAETYKGVSGSIYRTEDLTDFEAMKDIPFAAATGRPVKAVGEEFIPDAYEELLRMEAAGKIRIRRYEENSEACLNWITRTVREEHRSSAGRPEYIRFLESKFPFLTKEE